MSVGEIETRPDEINDPQHRTPLSESNSHMSTASSLKGLPPDAQHEPNADGSLPNLRVVAPELDPVTSPDTLYAVPTLPSAVPSSDKPALHRLGEVRKQQGVSRRNVARRMNIELETVREHEDPANDLPLSVLYAYQKILDVPVADLLVDHGDPLSAGVLDRARLVRLMKTAAAILEKAEGVRLRRLAQMLVEQLVEMMPELKEVAPWHTVGRRRSLEDYGRILERVFPDDVFGTER